MSSDWTPTNRATVRICSVLLRAHREDRIALSHTDVTRCTEALQSRLLGWPIRKRLGALWDYHNGWQLAEQLGQVDRMPQPVREELERCA